MGLINGVLSARLLPSFIMTVATISIYHGLVSLPADGAPEMLTDASWTAINTSSVAGVPIIILLAVWLDVRAKRQEG